MAIESGKLRHRLSLQRNHPTQDSTGDLIDDWREYGKAWAAIEPLSARDLISAQAGQSKVVARIVIRHRTGILSTDRIVHGSAVYKIEGLL
ncbi:MAG TPA: phage head closure protein, partial [Spongiibacteraceae bacterium]|nr:phage head closure protein [Spongiibacteraceae bacterium]